MTDLINVINKAEPEAIDHIFLLGTTITKHQTETVFMSHPQSCEKSTHVYLLILVTSGKECHKLGDKIESHCRHHLPVTAIVLKTAEFSRWLQEAHSFAYRVAGEATLLYSRNGAGLPVAVPPDEEKRQKEAAALYKKGAGRAASFFAGAQLYALREEYAMAAFMLQQAAEQVLKTNLQLLSGYNCNTHNLDKLVRYGTLVSAHLPGLFGRGNPKDDALFSLLQRAYIEARYRDTYSISGSELSLLTGKVEALMQHAKEVWLNSLAEEEWSVRKII